jgi:putative intracellular protease/amidase
VIAGFPVRLTGANTLRLRVRGIADASPPQRANGAAGFSNDQEIVERMIQTLNGQQVAVIVAAGFDEHSFTEIQRALAAAGAKVTLVSPETGVVNGWQGQGWGHYFPVDKNIAETLSSDFHAVVVPGGERSIEKMAEKPHVRRVLRGFVETRKPTLLFGEAVALLAHLPEAKGRTVSAAAAHAEALGAAGLSLAAETVSENDGLITVQGEDFAPAIARFLEAVAGARIEDAA